MSVPLASAAKVALGFCIAKWVEEKSCKWNEIIEEISFDPKEDSHILYPHLQHRNSITLQDAVEVMIVCHDSVVANRIVQYFGGWGVVNQKIQSYFDTINITENPRDLDNKGKLNQLMDLLCQIIQEYKTDPAIWIPVIKGLVRPIDSIEGIPNHLFKSHEWWIRECFS
jgi:beta-lactamase class A